MVGYGTVWVSGGEAEITQPYVDDASKSDSTWTLRLIEAANRITTSGHRVEARVCGNGMDDSCILGLLAYRRTKQGNEFLHHYWHKLLESISEFVSNLDSVKMPLAFRVKFPVGVISSSIHKIDRELQN